jgi:hypothetical protein
MLQLVLLLHMSWVDRQGHQGGAEAALTCCG